MRINLVDPGTKRRKRRRKRSRTFETALAEPRLRPGRQARKRAERPKRRPPRTRPQASRTDVAATTVEARHFPWRAVLRRLPVALILAGLIAGLAYTSTAAEFFVYEAGIIGAKHLGAGAIYQAAGIHEQNIFWIRPHEVAERVGQLGGIKSVRVQCRVLPTRVTIEVVEREPVVLWRALSQEHDWWLDEEGWVLPYHGDPYSPQALFVVDSSERQLQAGERIEPEGAVQSVQQLAEALPGTQVFFYRADRGLSFNQQIDGGEWPVYVGTSQDLARKIQILQALNRYFASNSIQPRYVDVRWADHPVYGRPAGQAAGGGE